MVCCPAPSVLQDEIAKNWLQAFDQVRYGAIMLSEVIVELARPSRRRRCPFYSKMLLFSYAFLLPPPSLQLVALSQPSVIALHCQEMGGKNFRQSMKEAAEFGQ